jgi:PIN domain nuclease of toxin-antitoxin system
MEIFILDSCVVIAFFKKEPLGTNTASLLKKCFKREIRLVISAVNLGEVYFTLYREKFTKAQLTDIWKYLLDEIGLDVITPTYQDCMTAAEYKTRGNFAYFDGFVLTVADKFTKQQPEIITMDSEFLQFQSEFRIRLLK